MKIVPALICALLVAACSGTVSLRSGTAASSQPAPSAGSSISGGPDGLRANINANAGPLLGIVIIGVMIADGLDYVRGAGRWTRTAPPLVEDRNINIQDCTRPVEYSLGNVSCQ